MATQHAVRVRELDSRDIISVLARNVVGRLAFDRGGEIDVIPLHYVYADDAIYCRTSQGGKLAAIQPSSRVAFEVDEVLSISAWRSVLVHGSASVCTDDSPPDEWRTALAAIRRLDHSAFQPDDRAPERTEILRIAIESVTGRALG